MLCAGEKSPVVSERGTSSLAQEDVPSFSADAQQAPTDQEESIINEEHGQGGSARSTTAVTLFLVIMHDSVKSRIAHLCGAQASCRPYDQVVMLSWSCMLLLNIFQRPVVKP